MTLRLWAALAAVTALSSGCNDSGDGYPQLLPLDQLLTPANVPAHAADAAQSPDSVNAQLQRRHGAPAAGTAGAEDLDARARALRERARALSARHPSDEEDAACVDADGAPCAAEAPTQLPGQQPPQ